MRKVMSKLRSESRHPVRHLWGTLAGMWCRFLLRCKERYLTVRRPSRLRSRHRVLRWIALRTGRTCQKTIRTMYWG